MNIIICDHCGNDIDNKEYRECIVIGGTDYHLCEDCINLMLKHWLSSGLKARDIIKRITREEE